ncbi:MAG: hydrogenase maturation nickel metallochaperone HypA [Cyclobacteriaceae bacterium]|nr:hydrogenase maturation nickel metallochaperone HypA [Cyclobacteriaceae bacterium]
MHEIYLVQNVLRTVEELFPDTPPEKIKCIHVRAGELSNVQPILMQNAFQAVVQDDARYQRTKLKVEVTPILIQCSACGKTTQVRNYTFVCECGRPSKNIIQGDELQLHDVEFY